MTGKPGVYLEDLYVQPAFRNKGIGKVVLAFLAHTALSRGGSRFEWSVLDWNEPSIQFYLAQGAKPMSAYTTHRVTGDALAALGARFKPAVCLFDATSVIRVLILISYTDCISSINRCCMCNCAWSCVPLRYSRGLSLTCGADSRAGPLQGC